MISSGQVIKPTEVVGSLALQPGMRAADFGCGHGHFTYAAARAVGATGVIYAVDLDKELVEAIGSEARSEGLPQIKPVWADLEIVGASKISDNSLDMVFILNSRITAETQYKIFAEAARVLRAGGQLAIIDWLEGGTVPHSEAVPLRVSKERTLANAAAQHFNLVDEFRPGQYHYGLKFAK